MDLQEEKAILECRLNLAAAKGREEGIKIGEERGIKLGAEKSREEDESKAKIAVVKIHLRQVCL